MPVHAIAVGYHNTLPLRAGLQSLVEDGTIILQLDRPNSATRRFADAEFSLGLLPVAAQLGVPEAQIVGNFGIVSDGFVGSVGVFAERPLDQLDKIYLDHDSRSSVLLARILFEHFWKGSYFSSLKSGSSTGLSPKLTSAPPGYRERISGSAGGLIIGDPAIEARKKFPFYYDLGEAWKQMTGLPFVFAAWLSVVPQPVSFVQRFDQAQSAGLDLRLDLARTYQSELPHYNLLDYFIKQIHYKIDARAREGMNLFLQLGKELLATEALDDSRQARFISSTTKNS